MRLGFGVTAWARGLLNGHIDGIGVYSENLWRENLRAGINARAVAFGLPGDVQRKVGAPQPLDCVKGGYPLQCAYSQVTGRPFYGTKHIESQIDVFHATDHHIPKLRHVPVVATIMDAIPLAHPEWVSARMRRIKNASFCLAARWASRVITISEFSKRDIVEYFGIAEEKITVIPLGYDESLRTRVDGEKRIEVLERYKLGEGFFLFVGTLQPRKNISRIIAAHRALGREFRRAHPLVIVGNYGWGGDETLNSIKSMEQNGDGHWLKWVPNEALRVLMQSATALVYPSLYEGFGLPVLEGFAAGIPVISSETTSIPEVAGDAAWLVEPTSIDEISFAMEKLAEDKKLAAEMVERGSLRLQQFSWASCAERTRSVYQTMV